MKTTKFIFIPIAALVLAGGVVYGSGKVYAQNKSDQFQPIAEKIAKKFGLKTEDVQAVFEEERLAREQEMKQKFEERLNTAVSEGKITAEQKQLILDKQQELMNERAQERTQLQQMSPTERKAHMQTKRTELENWAKEHGIDLKYLLIDLRKGPSHRELPEEVSN